MNDEKKLYIGDVLALMMIGTTATIGLSSIYIGLTLMDIVYIAGVLLTLIGVFMLTVSVIMLRRYLKNRPKPSTTINRVSYTALYIPSLALQLSSADMCIWVKDTMTIMLALTILGIFIYILIALLSSPAQQTQIGQAIRGLGDPSILFPAFLSGIILLFLFADLPSMFVVSGNECRIVFENTNLSRIIRLFLPSI